MYIRAIVVVSLVAACLVLLCGWLLFALSGYETRGNCPFLRAGGADNLTGHARSEV